MFIRRKGVWRPQFVPSGPVEMDDSHPARAQIADGWLLNQHSPPSITGLTKPLVPIGAGLPTLQIGEIGPYVNFPGDRGFQSGYYHSSTQPFSALVVAMRNGPQQTGGSNKVSVVATSHPSGASVGFELDFGNAYGPVPGGIYASTGNTSATAGFYGGIAQTSANPFITTLPNSTFAAALATFAPSAPSTPVCIGMFQNGNFYLNGGVALVVMLTGAASTCVGQLLTAEPFGIFRPRTVRRYYARSASPIVSGRAIVFIGM